MHVVKVSLRDFRSYGRCEVTLGPGVTVVHGPNGAGKSNLLEAICFALTGRSSRTRNDRELIRFGCDTTRVTVEVCDGGHTHVLSVGYGVPVAGDGPGDVVKRMRVDNAPVSAMTDVQVRPLVSVFMPDRLELLKGPPSTRRAHLDQFAAALRPTAAANRRLYAQALAQRNAMLGRIRNGSAPRSHLVAWDHKLATHAVTLRDDRQRAVDILADLFRDRARELGLEGEADLVYRPRSRAGDVNEMAIELGDRLDVDLQHGFTTHGPHRDRLILLRDQRDLRSYGSQGEQRLAVLSLLLAERTALGEIRADPPLMLLDDVMSELDERRRVRLCEELADGGQSVIATTDVAHVPVSGPPEVTRIAITPGAVLQEARAA